ncbi:hypothetical protein Aph01nite_44590 [Acrocarpospora phusangensis]|uniref:Uncharacterized protein n=1 Tax=Acrocarpospora phusangensis TaxID=1070424 RepID=A0A919ULN1_9ACTN|nr:hypothetical protein [Acrocarpospora phusangensis]GIH26149.1 hypothetical protein Aph01nite_44590 [Acrocarpospora phusangensis]
MKLITIASALLVGGAWLVVVPIAAEAQTACSWTLVARGQKKAVGTRTIRLQKCGGSIRATLTGGRAGDVVRLEIRSGPAKAAKVLNGRTTAITASLTLGSRQARSCGTPVKGSKSCTAWWPSTSGGPPPTIP